MVEIVSIRTKMGGISLGKLDDQDRLVKMTGYWYPTSNPDNLDRVLREYAEEIIHDGGKLYRDAIKGIFPL